MASRLRHVGRLRPGTRESFRVTVKSPKGEPLGPGMVELLAYMYDKSLDLFGAHYAPSVPSIYPSRGGISWSRSNLSQTYPMWLVALPAGVLSLWRADARRVIFATFPLAYMLVVASGTYAVDELRRSGADFVLASLEEPFPLTTDTDEP